MPQQQTSVTALLKHRSHLLHFMVNSQLDPTCELALIFDKAACQHSGDKRKMVHPCHFVTSNAHGGQNSWFSSSVSDSGSIGPCPLIRVSEMVGYDPDSRPGAAARVEQTHGFISDMLLILWVLMSSLLLMELPVYPNLGRKGVPAHTQILQSYFRGMEFTDSDRVVFADVVPNRPVLCFRACVFKTRVRKLAVCFGSDLVGFAKNAGSS